MTNLALVDKIANAVLYEGYMLYPYRPSSVKNRQRWTFGGLYPRPWSAAQGGGDAWAMQTECLATGGGGTKLSARPPGRRRSPPAPATVRNASGSTKDSRTTPGPRAVAGAVTCAPRRRSWG